MNQEEIQKNWEALNNFDKFIQIIIERIGEQGIPHLTDKASCETKNMIEELRKNDEDRDKKLNERLDKFEKTLEPISRTYNGVAFTGKMGGILLGLFVTVSGLIWGWVEFGGKIVSYFKR